MVAERAGSTSPGNARLFAPVAIDQSAHQLIPSAFPPVDTFAEAASADDLAAVLELEGWTNDRVVLSRLSRLLREQWSYGTLCASIVMGAFLHGSPMRFSSEDLGAWYAASTLKGAIAEVAHHRMASLVPDGQSRGVFTYREYLNEFSGVYHDMRAVPASPAELDPTNYIAGQVLGDQVRKHAYSAQGPHGIAYPSVRLRDADNFNIVCFAPRRVMNPRQAGHFRLDLTVPDGIIVRRLA